MEREKEPQFTVVPELLAAMQAVPEAPSTKTVIIDGLSYMVQRYETPGFQAGTSVLQISPVSGAGKLEFDRITNEATWGIHFDGTGGIYEAVKAPSVHSGLSDVDYIRVLVS